MGPTWRKILVTPSLPPALAPVKEMACNLLWVWTYEIRDVFRLMDPELWRASGYNPIKLLDTISQHRLNALVEDAAFLAQLERARAVFEDYRSRPHWFQREYPDDRRTLIAYFSAEFGLAACLPNYSGGLGMLAGDHLKSASDLGIPLVGVGILYQEGYFRQYLNMDGWQQERYPKNDFYNMPVQQVRREDGQPVKIAVDLPGRPLHLQVWVVQVGRVPLYLMDANLPENRPEDRALTNQLYGGGRELRLQQEIVLGIGGMRALRALGAVPTVYHINEGHAAFLTLERILQLMEDHRLSFEEAQAVGAQSTLFTTHTPVPAGFDIFHEELIAPYFRPYAERMGVSWETFRHLGDNGEGNAREFNMAKLAFRQSVLRNGVSTLHGRVSRKMFHYLWADFPLGEVPIGSVTNGVHTPTWVGFEIAELLDRYLGPNWRFKCDDAGLWKRVEHIPHEELWRAKQRAKERLISYARRMMARQLTQRGLSPRQVSEAYDVLDSRVLTVGFARRFATYKRGNLLLSNMERLRKLVLHSERPIQLIFAGKAHPADNEGKELIRQIVHVSGQPDLRHRIAFLEDYDMDMALHLVQGVDVWLNTPRRPLEACGTSGMKVVPNGGLNLSIPDGWWEEAYLPGIGWSIGSGEMYDDPAYQDQVESDLLYNLLETEVVPLYYDTGGGSHPRGWIGMMKESMIRLAPFFNSHRMLHQYANNYYVPISRHTQTLTADGAQRGRALVEWERRIQAHWKDIGLVKLDLSAPDTVPSGSHLPVGVDVRLGTNLTPEDVRVELYYGPLDANHQLQEGEAIPLAWKREPSQGIHRFEGEMPLHSSGLFGYAVRVTPAHQDLILFQDLRRIHWA